MKVKLKILATTFVVMFFSCSANAAEFFDGKVKASGFLASQWQSGIEAGPQGSLITAGDGAAESGFNRLKWSMWLDAQVTDKISGFVELSEEQNDFGETGEVNIDLGWIQYKFNDEIVVKLGHIVDTTMNFIRYTDGAIVQSNPLIGNGVNDIITAETGLWFTGTHNVSLGAWDWNATVTNPSFGEDFSNDKGYNFSLRSSLTLDNGIGVGAGYFKTTGDAACPTPTTCTMANGGTRAGGPLQGDGDPYSFAASGTGSRNKHVGLAPGINADAWQVDLMYSGDKIGVPILVHGFYGQVEDDYSFAQGDLNSNAAGNFSTTDAEYDFWGLFGKLDINDSVYIATRYTATSNEATGITTGEDLYRIQAGGGYWYNDSTLIKAEYVYQEEEAFSGGGLCTHGSTTCDWDGFVLEASISF